MSKFRKASLLLTCTICIADSLVLGAGTSSFNATGGIRVLAVHQNAATIYAYPAGTLPIAGFEPKVALVLTDEQDSDDTIWTSSSSNLIMGSTLPFGGSTHVSVATFDSGGQSTLLSYSDANAVDLAGADRAGINTIGVTGASGSEDVLISNPLGVWTTGLSNVTAGTTPTVAPSTLKGQYNVSILSAQQGSSLPSFVGLPMLHDYGVLMKNSQTIRKTIAGTTYRTPDISLHSQNPTTGTGPITGLNHKITLSLLDVNNSATSSPAYLPDFTNVITGDPFNVNPIAPTFWTFPFANVNLSHTGGSLNQQQFLFDTGAQVSILSEETALNIGFDVTLNQPDFTVEVAGVGGVTQVPGFYMQAMTIPALGGSFSFTNVPILVLNVADPRDGIGFVPGIVGMNLFSDRDLFVNLNTADPYVRVSDAIAARWNVNSGGLWSTDGNWQLGVPDGVDLPANFTSAISSAQTVTLDIDATVGSISFDNASKYTINGTKTLTVNNSVAGTITVLNGSHDINAPLKLDVNTGVAVTNAASTLKIANLLDTTKSISKSGAGTLEVNRVRAASLGVNAGKVKITSNGTAAGVSIVDSLSITTAAGAQLDLANNGLIVRTTGARNAIWNLVASGQNGVDAGSLVNWSGPGIISSTARAQNVSRSLNLYAIGVIRNGDLATMLNASAMYGPSNPFMGSIGNVSAEDILVRYTYNGDTNLDGSITFSDYVNIDSTYGGLKPVLGWVSGDFNNDGSVTFEDYVAIDTAYAFQAGSLSQTLLNQRLDMFGPAYVAEIQSIVASLSAVPEPATVGMLALAAMSILSRRRRI